MSATIRAGSRVRLHFSLRLTEAGSDEAIESTFGRDPATLVLGQGPLLPGFEAVLEGLAAGARQVFTLTPEQGFGPHRAANVQRLPQARFAGLAPAPGLVVQFSEAAGSLPGVVTAVDADWVTVDFNHPLSGRTLLFEVEILGVEPPEAA